MNEKAGKRALPRPVEDRRTGVMIEGEAHLALERRSVFRRAHEFDFTAAAGYSLRWSRPPRRGR